MHIYRCISELGQIQAQDIHVNTCTTYDHKGDSMNNRWNNWKINSSLIQESIALCFNLSMV